MSSAFLQTTKHTLKMKILPPVRTFLIATVQICLFISAASIRNLPHRHIRERINSRAAIIIVPTTAADTPITSV